MASTLREVLRVFETANGPLSLNDIARDLDITPGMLDGMIEHWVRKGKIRPAAGGSTCSSCSHSKSCCTYSPAMPRSYLLVTDDPDPVAVGGCSCCTPARRSEENF